MGSVNSSLALFQLFFLTFGLFSLQTLESRPRLLFLLRLLQPFHRPYCRVKRNRGWIAVFLMCCLFYPQMRNLDFYCGYFTWACMCISVGCRGLIKCWNYCRRSWRMGLISISVNRLKNRLKKSSNKTKRSKHSGTRALATISENTDLSVKRKQYLNVTWLQ